MGFSEAERQRQLLEENMHKLRTSLRHWQTWEAEYEGLKEELVAAGPEDLDVDSITGISKAYDGSLVTEKEILALAGLDKPDSPLRSRRQILGLISHRQEYVQKNIETVQRQFFAAEGKLEEFAFASVTAGGVYGDGAGEVDEAGLPLTEIHEELDDEGNVLTSELRRPEENAGAVLERLRKAGLSARDLGMGENEEGGDSALPKKSALVSPISSPTATRTVVEVGGGDRFDDDAGGPHRPPIRKKSVSFTVDTKPAEDERSESQERRKSVSFNEKIAIARAADPPDTRSVSFSPNVEEIPPEPIGPPLPKDEPNDTLATTQVQVNANLDRQQDLRASFKPGERVYEIDENAETTTPHVVLPPDESEEDARMRREMLEYNLNEVNNVVAQMDLDDDDDDDEHDDSHSEITASEYQDEDTPYTSGLSDSDNESEDEFGRSKRKVITDEYRKEMEALQERLIGNLGRMPKDEEIQDADPELNPDDVRRLVIRNKRSSISSAASSNSDNDKKATRKKRVSFAEELDVAQPASPPHKAVKHTEGETATPLLAEGVVERSPALQHSTTTTTTTNTTTTTTAAAAPKPSLFKQARTAVPIAPDTLDGAADADEPPTGPPGIPMADQLLERTPIATPAKAPDADGYDPVLARRELAADYYRRRNDMVREQGGFKATGNEDEGLGELMEERNGKVKKVSRFKAARLGR